MNPENQPNSPERKGFNPEELEVIAHEQEQAIHERQEREASHEQSTAERLDEARHETHEVLAEQREQHETAKSKPHEVAESEPQRPANKQEKRTKFTEIMQDTQKHMSPGSRAFSKVIHNPAVERVSEVGGKTIARPNAILSGSVSAFVLVLAVYLIARYYGYPLSGTETIVAFTLGWIIGLMFDYFKAMFTGGRSSA